MLVGGSNETMKDIPGVMESSAVSGIVQRKYGIVAFTVALG